MNGVLEVQPKPGSIAKLGRGNDMNKTKVVKINSESLKFDNGVVLTSDHEND